MKFRHVIWILVLMLMVSAGTAGGVSANTLPAAPTLVSPADGETGVHRSPTLVWEPVEGATSYYLEIIELTKHHLIPIFTIVEAWAIPTNSYEPGDLPSLNQYAEAGSYQWRVRARNAAGYGPWSETWSFSVDPGPIQPPLLSSPSNGAVNQPTTLTIVWWAAGMGGFGGILPSYHLQVSTNSDFTSLVVDQTGISFFTRSFTVSGLAPGTTYFWRVSAATPSRPSAGWSTVWNFTTAP